MSNLASAAQTLASSAADDASILGAEQRLRALAELREIGMDMARALGARARMEESRIAAAAGAGEYTIEDPNIPAAAKGRDAAELFAPVSRAIRLTISLEAKADKELRDLKAGTPKAREAERRPTVRRAANAAANGREAHTRVRCLVLTVAEREAKDFESLDELIHAMNDYLLPEEARDGLAGAERPLRETVERVCKVLSLCPDWSCWTGKGWTEDYEAAAKANVASMTSYDEPPAIFTGRPAPQTPIPDLHDLQ